MEITQLLPEDAKDALTFLEKVSQETDFLTFDVSVLDKDLKKASDFYQFLKNPINGLIIKCVIEDKIVGVADIQRPSKQRLKHNGELSVSVLKEYWGNKIGEQLLSFLINWAKNQKISRLSLIVRVDNISAIRLYDKFGFIVEGRTKGSIRVDQNFYDEYLMALYL